MENLISLKNTGNCNEVFNDCLIGIEHWSGSLLRNKPAQDNTNIGTLITFNVGRKTQIYISSTGVYTRVNQATQDENTWTPWVKLIFLHWLKPVLAPVLALKNISPLKLYKIC